MKPELRKNHKPLSALNLAVVKGPSTLLYGAKDEEHNESVVLIELLTR